MTSYVSRLGPTQTEQEQEYDGINIVSYYFPILLILYEAELVSCLLSPFSCVYFFQYLHSL